jgi:hypothetical protein
MRTALWRRVLGNELKCRVRFGKQSSEGKALLETSFILFRGEIRLKILFAEIQSAKAVDGELRVHTKEGTAVFELGDAAGKWCEKILHPKSRIEKLGVKAGAKIRLIGEFEAEFRDEVKAATKKTAKNEDVDGSETIFIAVSVREELVQVGKIAKTMRGAASLWIVYPKGQKQITENDVIGAGRKARLKDVKVVGISATHTALKFVIPVGKR